MEPEPSSKAALCSLPPANAPSRSPRATQPAAGTGRTGSIPVPCGREPLARDTSPPHQTQPCSRFRTRSSLASPPAPACSQESRTAKLQRCLLLGKAQGHLGQEKGAAGGPWGPLPQPSEAEVEVTGAAVCSLHKPPASFPPAGNLLPSSRQGLLQVEKGSWVTDIRHPALLLAQDWQVAAMGPLALLLAEDSQVAAIGLPALLLHTGARHSAQHHSDCGSISSNDCV